MVTVQGLKKYNNFGTLLLRAEKGYIMSYKVIITNNETGEVVLNKTNAVAIIGAVTDREKTTTLGHTKCNMSDLADTIVGAEGIISQLKEQCPNIEFLLSLRKIKNICEDL